MPDGRGARLDRMAGLGGAWGCLKPGRFPRHRRRVGHQRTATRTADRFPRTGNSHLDRPDEAGLPNIFCPPLAPFWGHTRTYVSAESGSGNPRRPQRWDYAQPAATARQRFHHSSVNHSHDTNRPQSVTERPFRTDHSGDLFRAGLPRLVLADQGAGPGPRSPPGRGTTARRMSRALGGDGADT